MTGQKIGAASLLYQKVSDVLLLLLLYFAPGNVRRFLVLDAAVCAASYLLTPQARCVLSMHGVGDARSGGGGVALPDMRACCNDSFWQRVSSVASLLPRQAAWALSNSKHCGVCLCLCSASCLYLCCHGSVAQDEEQSWEEYLQAYRNDQRCVPAPIIVKRDPARKGASTTVVPLEFWSKQEQVRSSAFL